MTHSKIQLNTCAHCPYFSDYRDRGRGLCYVFDKVVRQQHPRTHDCVTAISTIERENNVNHTTAYPVMVQLATKEVEDNGDGYAVPVDTVQLLVAVARLASETVIAAVTAMGYGEDYVLQDWWRPVEEEVF